MFLLPEFSKLIATNGVKLYELHQCKLGCDFKKPTQLIGTVKYCHDFECDHPKQWFREVPSGRWIFAAHPPLAGKFKAVPASQWRESFRRWRPTPGQPFLTKSTANYPKEMNHALAVDLVNAAIGHVTHRLKREVDSVGERAKLRKLSCFPGEEVQHSVDRQRRSVGEATVQFTTPLKGQGTAASDKQHQERQAIGGLRNPARAARQVGGAMREVGAAIRAALEGYIRARPKLAAHCVSAIGTDVDNVVEEDVIADC